MRRTAGCAGGLRRLGRGHGYLARGTFWQVNAGDTGYVHGDLSLDFREDGTYTGTWTTYVEAGSSRGGTSQVAGRFVVAGDRVILTDWRDRTGGTLYGLTVDPGSGRTIQVRLDRAAARP